MGFNVIWLLVTALSIFVEGSISWVMASDNFTLPANCTKTCGDIKFDYPFGIDNGCFYAIGFNLTCTYDSRLLLGDGNIQVRNFDIENGLVYIESPYVILNVDAQSINTTTLINLKNLPLSLNLNLVYFRRATSNINRNYLHVVGCGVIARIQDVATTSTMDYCSTIWPTTTDTSTTEQRLNHNSGYCVLDLNNINSNKETWGIQLTRFHEKENEHEMIKNSTSDITATLIGHFTDHDSFERFINDQNRTGIAATLAWYINDNSTCEVAKRTSTYACRSPKSECNDVLHEDSFYSNESSSGYICRCSLDYVGNPYLPDGCQPEKNFTSSPVKGCKPKCGDFSISFPFGLEKGCYRSEDFALTCNDTNQHPTLLYGDYYTVSKISVQEGQLEYYAREDMYDYYSDRLSHFTSFNDTLIRNWVIAHSRAHSMINIFTYYMYKFQKFFINPK